MPPKSSSGKEKDLTDEEDVLQAVILADSFNKRFKPLTVGKPRCLLPVCGATLLDWTFESLALAGVQEIYVICRSYPELIKAAIRDSKWSKASSGIKIVPIITSRETFTPGDAMRDIYTRGIITTDFVLVMGDLVSNVRIDEVVRVHKERRRMNKDAIMTMVVKESGGVHRTRSRGESSIFVLDSKTSECLHYEHVTGYPPKKHAKIPREILKEHPEVEVRFDLIDCSIDVCSFEVPSLFQDNFDYGDIRRDFVHGVLTSDLLMKSIHCYVLKEGYAARVADTRSYDAVSKDILSRWTFPLVPDDNHPGGHSYEHLRGNKYIARGDSVVLSRTCKIGSNTLIGAHTEIGDNVTLQASVIGQHCIIGPNVALRNAYIFDGTHIGANSTIEDSIIGADVRVGERSKIESGCLVGDGVILGNSARLGKFERISKRREITEEVDDEENENEIEEDEDSELEEVEAHQDSTSAIIGEGSNAIVWPKGPREDDEELDEVERFDNQRLMRLGDTASDLELQDVEESSSDSDSDSEATDSDFHPLSRTSSATSTSQTHHHHHHLPSTPSAIHSLQAAAADSEFQHEVTLSLERAFAENHSVDNAAVELKTLRMASNVELRKVREAVVAAIVEKIQVVEGDSAEQRKQIAQVVARWGPLIDKIGGIDPVETVEVLQYHCARSTRLPLFGQILAALYQSDMVEEDDIRAWHAKPAAKGEDIKGGTLLENIQRCWSVGEKMIQQFDEQESESEEEENESTDEDEDDDHEENKDGRKKDGDDGSEEESEEESEDEDKAIGKAPPRHPQLQEETEDDDGEEEEEEEEEEGSEKGSSNEGEIAIPTQIKPNPAIHKAAASQETIKATASMSSREIVTPTGNRNSVATVSTAPQVEATQTLPDAKSTPTKGTGVPVVNEEPRHVEESEDDGHDASGEESSEEESDEEHDETSDAKPLRKETNRPDLQSSISGSSPTPPVVSISPPLGTEGPQTIQEPQTPKAKDPKSKSTLAPVAEDVHKAEAGSSGYLSASEASSSKPASTVSSTKVGVGKAGVEEKPEAKDPTTVSVDDHQEHVGEESEESGIDTEEYTDETEEDSE